MTDQRRPDVSTMTDEERQLAVTFMTTEHFTLMTARSIATAETNGRSALYLSTLSSALVALGFLAQSTEFGQPFGIFACLTLPPIFFLGFVTFQRAIQAAINDVFHAVGLARVRSFYVALLPAMRPWFMEPTDEVSWSPSEQASSVGRWQLALTVASAIAVTNSVVGGAVCAIALDLVSAPPLWVTIVVGLIAGTISGVLHFWYENRAWARTDAFLQQPNPLGATDRSPGAG